MKKANIYSVYIYGKRAKKYSGETTFFKRRNVGANISW